jgi:hypothetical protein
MKNTFLTIMMIIGLSSFNSPGILPKIQKVKNQSVLVTPTEKVIVTIFDDQNRQIHQQVINVTTKFNLSNLSDGKYRIVVKTLNSKLIDEQEVTLKTETLKSII